MHRSIHLFLDQCFIENHHSQDKCIDGGPDAIRSDWGGTVDSINLERVNPRAPCPLRVFV